MFRPASLGPVGWARVSPGQHAGCVLAPFLEAGLGLDEVTLEGEWASEYDMYGATAVSKQPKPTAPGGSLDQWVSSFSDEYGYALTGLFAKTVGGNRKAWRLEPGLVVVDLLGLRKQLAEAAAQKFLAVGMVRALARSQLGTRSSKSAGVVAVHARTWAALLAPLAQGIVMPTAKEALEAAGEVARHASLYFPEMLLNGDSHHTASIHPPLVVASLRALGARG